MDVLGRFGRRNILVGLLAAAMLGGAAVADDDDHSLDTDWESKIEAALDADFSADAVDVPLDDFLRFVEQKAGILVLIDERSLDDIGMDKTTPIACHVSNIRLRSVLRLVLRPLELTWDLRDGALLITTIEQAESKLTAQSYEIADLIDGYRPTTGRRSYGIRDSGCDAIAELLTGVIAPRSWNVFGGPGVIGIFRDRLIVSQTPEVHKQIANLFHLLRRAQKILREHGYDASPTACLDSCDVDPAVQKILAALKKPCTLDFDDTPLEDVAVYLGEQAGINVQSDTRSLDYVGLGTDVPITFHARQIRMDFALRHILRNLDLSYVIRDQVLLITTPERSERQLLMRLYPVADLLGRPTGTDMFGEPIRPAPIGDLTELISTTVALETWDKYGGPASIASVPNMDVLAISQSNDVHDQIVDLLMRLRKKAKGPEAAQPTTQPNANDAPTRLVIYPVPSPAAPASNSTSQKNASAVPDTASRPALLQLVQFGGGGMGGPATLSLYPPIPEGDLVDLITELIEPQSWSARDDVSARAVPGRLFIRHTDAVHRQIERLLARLLAAYAAPSRSGHSTMGGGMGGYMDGMGSSMF